MTIEELTDDERAWLESWRKSATAKALRIIDAHAADRAALVAQVAELTRERDSWRRTAETLTRERDEARDDLDKTDEALQESATEVTRLEAALAAANTECDSRAAAMRELRAALAAAERQAVRIEEKASSHFARAEAAEARVRELAFDVGKAEERARRAESSLAAANALLVELNHKAVIPCTDDGNDLSRRVDAHLANQPTAPATRQVRDLGSLDIADGLDEPAAPTRTEANREQDVFPGMPPAGWKP